MAALLVFLGAAPAQASFHLIKVREVFPGTAANPDSAYVELQMYAAAQNLVQLGELEVLNSAGAVTNKFTPSSSVTHSLNQSTVLIADSGFTSQFPTVTPDFADAGLNLNPAGGAVCWPQTEPPFDDCASWGSFSAQGSLPSPGDAAPAAPSGIPNGMAIQRTILPGCATLLENADDTNRSSVDFLLVGPAPRNNATTPSEHECPLLPNTAIDSKPVDPTKETAAAFTYHAIPATGAEFECRLDAALFALCPNSGIAYPGPLAEGGHSFEVRAVNSAGPDATPEAYSWTIDTKPPSVTITNKPENPSPGGSANFKYQSSEAGSTFQCSLTSGAEADNFSSCEATGRTYTNLADGTHTFKVRATDQAGNSSTPEPFPLGTFAWTVDNSLADLTPPETAIASKPPDPSASPTASFTYASNESGSSFECALDGGGFSGCPATGITYTGLGSGPHTFQVQAIDASGNADPSPAGYSFQVVLVASLPPGLAPTPILAPRPAAGAKPNTALSSKPASKTRDRTPSFRFSSASPGASFQCKLDSGPFKPCRSPLTTKKLSFGRHLLQVRAIVGGVSDPSPAAFKFKVVKR